MRGSRASARISALSSSVSRAALYWSPFFCSKAMWGQAREKAAGEDAGRKVQHAGVSCNTAGPVQSLSQEQEAPNPEAICTRASHLDVVGLNVNRVDREAVPRVLGSLKAVLVDA